MQENRALRRCFLVTHYCLLMMVAQEYTKLADDNLTHYIDYKVSQYSATGGFSNITQGLLKRVINVSQNFMIEHLGESSVSQRDVQRCFSLIKFFHKHAPKAIRESGEAQAAEKLMQSAVILASSVAYFFRLPTDEVGRPVLRERYTAAVSVPFNFLPPSLPFFVPPSMFDLRAVQL
jgi:hypothetical protein